MRFRNHLTEVCYSSVTLRLCWSFWKICFYRVQTWWSRDLRPVPGRDARYHPEPRFEDSVKFFFGSASVLSWFFYGQRNWNFQVGPSLDWEGLRKWPWRNSNGSIPENLTELCYSSVILRLLFGYSSVMQVKLHVDFFICPLFRGKQ